MTALTHDFATQVARRIDRLADHLSTAGPDETRRILNAVLDAEDGVLGRIITLLAAASYRAQHHGDPHAAVYRQIANDLHDLVLDADAAVHPTPPTPTPASPALATAPASARRSR